MTIDGKVFEQPGIPAGQDNTRISIFVTSFPWQNAKPKELAALIARLTAIHQMAESRKHNPVVFDEQHERE